MRRARVSAWVLIVGLLLTTGCRRDRKVAMRRMDDAKNAVEAARGAGAETYARRTFKEAFAKFQQSEMSFRSRDYIYARNQAEESVAIAHHAIQEARRNAETARLQAIKAQKAREESRRKQPSRRGRPKTRR